MSSQNTVMFLNIFAINMFSCGLTICQIHPCFCLKWNQICRIQDSHSVLKLYVLIGNLDSKNFIEIFHAITCNLNSFSVL